MYNRVRGEAEFAGLYILVHSLLGLEGSVAPEAELFW